MPHRPTAIAAAFVLPLLFGWLAAAPAIAVVANQVSQTERATVRLLADREVAAPGDTVTLALHQTMVGDWHTYWENPGDSGLATSIQWTLPDGVSAGDILWPTPARIPIPPLANYGYSGEAILLSEMTVPVDWPAGVPIAIKAQADWLICEEICVPEGQTFTLTVPTGEAAVPDAAVTPIVARGRSMLPTAADDVPASWSVDGEEIVFAIAAPELASSALADVYLFPAEWGLISHSAGQSVSANGETLHIRVPKGDGWLTGPIEGGFGAILTAVDGSSPASIPIALALAMDPSDAAAMPGGTVADGQIGNVLASDGGTRDGGTPAPAVWTMETSLISALTAAGLALLGGLILNLMPCVFPVLALKALSLTQHASGGARSRLMDGAGYGSGVLVSFLVVAGGLVALKSAGAAVGWGFQLQSPIVVAVLAYVFIIIGLNLAGVFEFSGRFAGAGGALADREGPMGSFFTGVLAVIVASPCTAPFMGAALGYALTQEVWVTTLVFVGLATGFAAPIVLLSVVPGLARLLPRPGPWMEQFRNVLAFPMFLAAAWLAWVLGKLAGVDALFAAMVGAVLLALAAWIFGRGAPSSGLGRVAAYGVAALSLIGASGGLWPSATANDGTAALTASRTTVEASLPDGVERYDEARLAALQAAGRPVFVNFTADWCISCKVNERLVLKSDAFADAMRETNAVYMIGDWTRRDDRILAVLERHGRAGVPLYLVYPAGGGAPQVLPQILTQSSVANALLDAAPRG